MRTRPGNYWATATMAGLLWAAPVWAQTPEEHAAHHPGDAPANAADTTGGVDSDGAGGMGGMGGEGGMGKMMEQMGAPKPKELYPTLMSLPDLPLEQRAAVQTRAHDRMQQGAALMSDGFSALSRAAPTDDFAAMQTATAQVREGLAQFESGLAAHRALAEGKAPRNVALQWFKREMSLLAPAGRAPRVTGVLGGPLFHVVTILILSAFVSAMLWMYFFKMRRASQLLRSLSAGGQSPAPAPVDTGASPSSATETARSSSPAPAATPPKFPAMKSRTEPEQKWSGKLRVCRVFEEADGVKTFRLAAESGVALPFTYYPGQFLTLSLNIDGKQVKRSYTIASTPTQLHYCAITVKREDHGLVSRFLHDRVKEADLLDVSAPNGKFTFTGEESASIVLVGGGVGITPLMGVIRYLTDIGWHGNITLLYCCRTTSDFMFREELEQLQQRHANLDVHATMTRAEGAVWMGLKGRFTAPIIGHLVPDIADRRVHVCGPPAMMTAMLEMLATLEVAEGQIETEAFGPAARPMPAPGADVAPVPASAPTVSFRRSNKSAPQRSGVTILDVADELGVEIENSCRVGQCGLCKVKLLSGAVAMDCEDALSAGDKAQGMILACQAKASEPVSVDA